MVNKNKDIHLEDLVKFIEKNQSKLTDRTVRIGMVGHVDTDCDSAASMFLLERIIKSSLPSIETQIILSEKPKDDVAQILGEYPSEFEYLTSKTNGAQENLKNPDIIIYVDGAHNPGRPYIPESWVDLSAQTMVFDHHDGQTKFDFGKIDTEECKSTVSLVYNLFCQTPDLQIDTGLATMCVQAIKIDTSYYTKATTKDFTANSFFYNLANKALLENLVNKLKHSQWKVGGSSASHSRMIEDICWFSFVDNISKEDWRGICDYAEEAINRVNDPILPLAIFTAIGPSDQYGRGIQIAISGKNCSEVATKLFGGGGDDGKAGGQIEIPYLFDEVMSTDAFNKLVEEELELRIKGSYLSKKPKEEKPKPKPIRGTETAIKSEEEKSLQSILAKKELDNKIFDCCLEAMKARHTPSNVASAFVYKKMGDGKTAITEDNVNSLSYIIEQFKRVPRHNTYVAYAVVDGPANMYVLTLVSSKEDDPKAAKMLAMNVFGEDRILEELSTDEYVVAKVDLFFEYAFGTKLLDCVDTAIKKKITSLYEDKPINS